MGEMGGKGFVTKGSFYASVPSSKDRIDSKEFDSIGELREYVNKIEKRTFDKHLVSLVDNNNDGIYDEEFIRFLNHRDMGKSLGVSNLRTVPAEGLDDSNVPFKSKGFVPNFAKFNPSNPPALRKPAIALKLKNKEIHYDPDSLMHYQAAENLNILPEEILEHGFINKGKYESSFFSDFEKIADREKAYEQQRTEAVKDLFGGFFGNEGGLLTKPAAKKQKKRTTQRRKGLGTRP